MFIKLYNCVISTLQNKHQNNLFISVLVLICCLVGLQTHYNNMDWYDLFISIIFTIALAGCVYTWDSLGYLIVSSFCLFSFSVFLYEDNYLNLENSFLLKYFLSSKQSILWMMIFFIFSTICYWLGMLATQQVLLWLGSVFSWLGICSGTVGMLVRWHEGYLISKEVGHVPISNLYEVVILFLISVSILNMYYCRTKVYRSISCFVQLFTVGFMTFIIWCGSGDINQPLVPALKSWWMKIHVPANFFGYSAFLVAASAGLAYLIKEFGERSSLSIYRLIPVFFLSVFLFIEPIIFNRYVSGKIMFMYIVVTICLLFFFIS